MSHPSPSPRPRRPIPPFLIGLTLLGLLFVGPAGRMTAQAPAPSPAAPAVAPLDSAKEDLERQKLAQEVLQLKIANGSHVLTWDRWASFLPFITALVAVIGLWFTYGKTLDDRSKTLDDRSKTLDDRAAGRMEDQVQRAKDREQQQAELRQHLDESFAAALTNLRGADDEGKAAAVVALLSFLKPGPEYADFHEQVFLMLQAMLKLICPTPGHDPYRDEVKTLFVRAFERTLAVLAAAKPLPEKMDLARTYLYRVDLAGLTLQNADVAFSLMQEANLSQADLFRVRGYGVQWDNADLSGANLGEARLKSASCHRMNFRGACLVAANLKGADLRNADFTDACLQSAHLEGAKLNGAKFDRADVNDTYFKEAIFGDSLQSLARAKNLRNKEGKLDARHFSDDVIKSLGESSVVANPNGEVSKGEG